MGKKDIRAMSYLRHHGILGQRWGKMNGPPYPLESSDHSQSEKKAGWRRSLDKSSGGNQNSGRKPGLSDGQKKAIKVGAALAITALAAYGGYRLYKSGALNGLLAKGKNLVKQPHSSVPPKPNHLNEAVEHGYKKVASEETFDDMAKKVNPYGKESGGSYNCWSCGIAGYLRSKGIDVKARGAETGIKDPKQKYSTIIKDIDKHTIQDKASALCKNRDEASKTLLNRFKDNGAEGICNVQWSNGRGGHIFNWRIEDGKVVFFDYQMNRISDTLNWNAYFSQVDQDKNCFFIRLDDAEFDWDNMQKFVRKL